MNVTNSPGLFVGVLGLGFVNVIGLYEAAAPSLKELRSKPQGELQAKQDLLDADILIGLVAGIVAFVGAVEMNSVWPVILFLGGFVLVSGWHHLVLNSPNN